MQAPSAPCESTKQSACHGLAGGRVEPGVSGSFRPDDALFDFASVRIHSRQKCCSLFEARVQASGKTPPNREKTLTFEKSADQ